MKFILFVEGDTEDLALSPFIKRWLDPKLQKPVKVQIFRFQGAGELIKVLPERAAKALDAPKGEVLAVFALLDLYNCPLPYPSHQMTAKEKQTWGKQFLESKVNHPHFRQFFAVHETEAWLLSEVKIFPASLQSSLTAKSQQPEAVNSDEPPGALLIRLYRTQMNRDYKKRVDGPKLFRELDPAVAYQKCPSLKPLLSNRAKVIRYFAFG